MARYLPNRRRRPSSEVRNRYGRTRRKGSGNGAVPECRLQDAPRLGGIPSGGGELSLSLQGRSLLLGLLYIGLTLAGVSFARAQTPPPVPGATPFAQPALTPTPIGATPSPAPTT